MGDWMFWLKVGAAFVYLVGAQQHAKDLCEAILSIFIVVTVVNIVIELLRNLTTVSCIVMLVLFTPTEVVEQSRIIAHARHIIDLLGVFKWLEQLTRAVAEDRDL